MGWVADKFPTINVCLALMSLEDNRGVANSTRKPPAISGLYVTLAAQSKSTP